MWQALLFASLACPGAYRPGHHLDRDRYLKLGEAFHEASHEGSRAATSLAAWNAEIHKELAPAVLEIFTHPCTKVFYGDFTNPEERRTGKYTQLKDDAAGLRVIWQLELDVAPGDRRLLSAITFWDYDFNARKPVPILGPDSLRVRVETVKFQKKGMMGLSYWLTPGVDGKIESLKPGVYIDEKGDDLYPGITVWARTDHCNSCHAKERSKYGPAHISAPYPATKGYRDYLAWVRKNGVGGKELEAVSAKLGDPKMAFLPEGLVEAARRSYDARAR